MGQVYYGDCLIWRGDASCVFVCLIAVLDNDIHVPFNVQLCMGWYWSMPYINNFDINVANFWLGIRILFRVWLAYHIKIMCNG